MKAAIDTFIKEMKDELAKKPVVQDPVKPTVDATPSPPTPTPTPEPKVLTIIDRGEPWYADGLGWGLTGVGAIGAGVSIGLLVSAKGLDDDANAEEQQSVRDDLRERASDRRLIGTIVGVAGGAALITGIVKLAIAPKDRERTVTASWNVSFDRSGIFVMGRF